MRIVLIGAGNVATSLGSALQKAGQDIVMIYSRTSCSASMLSSLLNVPYTTSLKELPNDADLYFSMLADDALIELAPQIVLGRENALFLHTAGSIPMNIWGDAGAKRYGVFYPMQTFSKAKQTDWLHLPLFVEGSDELVTGLVLNMANSISDKVQILDSKGRKRLHLAAVFACNFANRMFAISEELLKQSGVTFDVMLPLVREMSAKVETISPAEAQTGPAARCDMKVMKSHIELLSNNPEWAELYKLISDDIIKSKKND